jgi:hypothetical protein
MIVQVQSLTEETLDSIRRDYLSGLSLWNVSLKYPYVRQKEIREALVGMIRPRHQQRTVDPEEAELAERRDQIKASWSDEVASRRWVGRYATKKPDRGSSLSALLRAMGGEG